MNGAWVTDVTPAQTRKAIRFGLMDEDELLLQASMPLSEVLSRAVSRAQAYGMEAELVPSTRRSECETLTHECETVPGDTDRGLLDTWVG